MCQNKPWFLSNECAVSISLCFIHSFGIHFKAMNECLIQPKQKTSGGINTYHNCNCSLNMSSEQVLLFCTCIALGQINELLLWPNTEHLNSKLRITMQYLLWSIFKKNIFGEPNKDGNSMFQRFLPCSQFALVIKSVVFLLSFVIILF